jgi:hypothetical protein
MASATGIPEQSFANEQEPLLGRPGDVSQGDEPIWKNLYIGMYIDQRQKQRAQLTREL